MGKLTYITTVDHIFPEQPRLVQVSLPAETGRPTVRGLWVPEEIEAILNGMLPSSEYPNPKFSALVQSYVAGYYVSASLCGDPEKRKPDFERLINLDEMWAMCFRAQKFNQWRLIGRFVHHNAFVGLALFRRSFLNGEKKYHQWAASVLGRWDETNPAPSVLRSDKIEDYISAPVRDVYAETIT